MENNIRSYFVNLQSQDKNVRYEAYIHLLNATEEKVDWAYEVLDDLKKDLTHPDHHRRSIAAQLLCILSKSDPENRILNDFSDVMAVTKDKQFVTARHSLQSIWKIGEICKMK